MRHTKGEWEIKPCDTELYSYIYSGDVRIAEVKSYGKDYKFFNDATVEEREANAKLIAAAPNMFEALNATKRLNLHNYPQGSIGREVFELINTAINKATK